MDKRNIGERMSRNITPVYRMIGAIFFLCLLAVSAHALTPGQVFMKVKDSVMVVKNLDSEGKLQASGSGVLISDGKVATNYHVLEGAAYCLVGQGKRLVPATLYAVDREKDICILNVKGIKGKPVQRGKAATLQVGDPVYAVGAPEGLELSLSDGIVSQLRGSSQPYPYIQTTAPISHGSSGGGLFDSEARLIGLMTFYLPKGQSLNFAVPVEWLNEIKPGRKPAIRGIARTDWLKKATSITQRSDWRGLLDWCSQWTKSETENAVAWQVLGMANMGLKNYKDAIDAYSQALRIDPKYTLAWENLGVAYLSSGNKPAALDAAERLRPLDPEKAEGLNGRINAH